jgi:tetratricopeptide (TPR) repeat protein
MSGSVHSENLPDAAEWRPPGRFSLARLRKTRGFWLYCAIPPLIVASTMIAATVNEATNLERRTGHYVKAVEYAYQAEDYTAAAHYYAKLKSFDYEQSPNARFIGAVLAYRSGRTDEAMQKLNDVAPTTRTGFRPAHLWRARESLASQPTPEQLPEIRHHLESALGIEEQEDWIRTNLGQVCAAQNDYPAALEHLVRVADEHPELYVLIAKIHQATGNIDSHLAALEKATQFAKKRLAQEPENTAIRIATAQLYHDQGDLKNALKVAAEGLGQDATNQELRTCVSQLLMTQFDQLRRSEGTVENQIAVLEKSVEMDATNQRVIAGLQSLMDGSDEDQAAAESVLNRMLAEGKSTGAVHFILGTRAVNDNDTETATLHFQQSYDNLQDLNESSLVPALLNNLAWLKMDKGKDIAGAIGLVQQALDLLPKSDPQLPFSRETRGQLFLRQEKWREAITDLEFSLPRLSDQVSAHKGLATAYRALGQSDMAAEHDRLASGKDPRPE